MCNHANREAAMTVLDDQTWCDPCLAPLIKALNDSGIRTTSSCCGHHHRPGWVSLADGRWLMIAPDDEWMNWLSSRIYERVGNMPGHEPIYVPTTTEDHRCGGYLGGGETCNKRVGHPEQCWEDPATPTTPDTTTEGDRA